MQVGMAMGPAPPFDAMRRRAQRLHEAGMGSFWWPDHLVAFHSPELWATGGLSELQPDPHVYADPFVCMSACAEDTGEALLGVCVTDAIRRNAATLAQTALSLDHLAPGRVVLGLGAGERANYEPYGTTMSSPARRLDEAAAQIRRLLDDPDPDEHGAVMGLRPPDGSPGPQLWVAAHGPKGFATAGRYADGWIPNFLTVDAWNAGRDQVRAEAAAAGRDPDGLTCALSVQVVVAEDRAAARALLDHPVLKAFALLLPPERFTAVGAEHPLGGGGLEHMVASQLGERLLEAAEQVPVDVVAGQMLHGAPEDIVADIRAYGPVDHLVLWDPVPLADLEAARVSTPGCLSIARQLRGDDADSHRN